MSNIVEEGKEERTRERKANNHRERTFQVYKHYKSYMVPEGHMDVYLIFFRNLCINLFISSLKLYIFITLILGLNICHGS